MSDAHQLNEVRLLCTTSVVKTDIKVQLTQFLRDKNQNVRQIALANLLGQTPKGSPHRDIFYSGLKKGGLQEKTENDVIRDLKILCRDQLVCILDNRLTVIDVTPTGNRTRCLQGSSQFIR